MKRISKLIIVALLLISIMSGVGSVFSVIILVNIESNLTNLYNKYTTTETISNAINYTKSLRSDILSIIVESDKTVIQSKIENLESSYEYIRELILIIQSTTYKTDDVELVKEISEKLEASIICSDKIFELVLADQKDKALTLIKEDYIPILDNMENVLSVIKDLSIHDYTIMRHQNKAFIQRYIITICILIIINIIITVILGRILLNEVKKSSIENEDFKNLASANELNNYQAQDELECIIESLNTTVKQLNFIIKDLHNSANKL